MNHLKSLIREVPDFPKPGINFYDITTLLKDSKGLQSVLDALKSRYSGASIDQVIGIEARGFFFAPAVAYAIGAGFVPVRKPKKLPAPVERVEYDGRAPVVYYRIEGDGHTWPGGAVLPEGMLGKTCKSLSASEEMWKFFSRFASPGR